MDVWKKISLYIIIILVIFGAGFLTSYKFSLSHGRAVDAEYKLGIRTLEDSIQRKDEIIRGIEIEIAELRSIDARRKEIDARREELIAEKDGQILSLGDIIQRLEDGDGGAEDSLDKIEEYYNEIAKRLRQAKETK